MSSHRRRSLALSFVDRYGLWSETQVRAAAAVDKAVVQKKLELVRFSFPDQHGVLRGESLSSAAAKAIGLAWMARSARTTRPISLVSG